MRFKRVTCILLILSVFNFVLPAPVPVQEVREACADVVERGENVTIVSGKRALQGDPYDGESDSDTEWWTPPSPPPPSPDHAGGSHPGVDMPPPPSSGSESPPRWFSKVWTIPGETEESLDPEGAFKPGTTTENQPPSSSKTKKVNFWHTTKVHFFEPDIPPPPEDQPTSSSTTKKVNFHHTTKVHFFEPDLPLPPEDQPASSSKTKLVSWSPSNEVLLPTGKIVSEPLLPLGIDRLPLPQGRYGYLAKTQQSPSPLPEIEDASLSSYFDPPPPPTPTPQSKGFASNFKAFFGKLGKPNFRPRFQRPDDTGA